MATTTFIPLANVTLASDVMGITLDAITQDYADLVLVVDATGWENTGITARLNADSSSIYSTVMMRNFNGSAYASTNSNISYFNVNNSGYFGVDVKWQGIFELFDYSKTDRNKTLLFRKNQPVPNDGGQSSLEQSAQTYASNSAITSITLTADFAAGSSFKLFGIHGEVV
jgi:hypothetical protein